MVTKDTYDWTVTTYDFNGKVLKTWRVKDKTEKQALKDAEDYITHQSYCHDWSLVIERPTYKRTSKRKGGK